MGLIRQYDDVTASSIPADAQACAGYCDANFAASWIGMVHRFPDLAKRQRVVSIATRASSVARIMDVEQGNPLTADEAARWVRVMIAHGVYRPGVYGNEPVIRRAQAVLAQQGVPRNHYILWLAKWINGVPSSLPPDVDMWQYTDHGPNGTDVSLAGDWCYPSSDPAPPADPQHYDWYPAHAFAIHGQQLSERDVARRYDDLRRHGVANRVRLRSLRKQCGWLAGRIVTVASEEPDANGDPSLGAYHRRWRLDMLTRRFEGQEV